MKKNIKKKAENQKKKLKLIVDYLVDSYYLNPKNEFVINEIRKKLKIKDALLIEEFILYLKKEKYINLNKKTNSFLLQYDGFLYLESIQRNNINYENKLISLIISIVAFFISGFSLIASSEAKDVLSSIVFVFLIVGIVCYSIHKIINKKYY